VLIAACALLIEQSAYRKKNMQGIADGGDFLRKTIANIPHVDTLPARGANVYDILKHKYLVLTSLGLADLVGRLERPIDRGFKPLGYHWRKHKEERAMQTQLERERRAKLQEWLLGRNVL
jgi:hypothetical protein